MLASEGKSWAEVPRIIRLKLSFESEEKLDSSVRAEYRRLWTNAQAIPSQE